MDFISRLFLRSGLLCLLLGLGLVLVPPGMAARSPWLSASWPVQLHLLTVGWLTQLIFGVAWWLFPRASRAEPARGVTAMTFSFALLQVGLVLRVIFEPMRGVNGWATSALLQVSALLQFVAAVLFVVVIWPRIRER